MFTVPPESARHERTGLSRNAAEGKQSSCQTPELLLYLTLKKERRSSFLWFLEKQKLWICASLKRAHHIYPYR